jgi:hypothetical protein
MSSLFYITDDSQWDKNIVYELTDSGFVIAHSLVLSDMWLSTPARGTKAEFDLSWKKLKKLKRGWVNEQENDTESYIDNDNRKNDSGISESERCIVVRRDS